MKAKSWIVLAVFIFCQPLWAQQNTTVVGRNFKRNVAAILFSSIGGAVLGLSTLSFYGEPQEHTNNITLGALLGFVGGSAYVLMDTTHPPVQSYDISFAESDQKLKKGPLLLAKNPPVLRFQYDF
jgi:hypothetical protein